MAVLQCADIAVLQFSRLVDEVTWTDDALLLAFSTADWKFEPFNVCDSSWLKETTEGRIFSPAGELRWRRFNDQFRIVYLGEEIIHTGLDDCSRELETLKPSIKGLYLWGVRSDLEQEWLEQQVPQRFNYPLNSTQINRGRVQILVEQWCDTMTGIPCFCRYHSIKEVTGGNHAA